MTVSEVWKATPRGMFVAVVLAFVLLNGLGIWQLERLKWKEGLIRDMAQSEAAAPVPADQLLSQARPAWRRATLPSCTLHGDQVIYMHSESAGQPGFRVLAACPLERRAILVDMGFTPKKLTFTAPVTWTPVGRLRPYEKASHFTIVNRVADNDWYWRSATEMGPVLKAELRSDYFVVADLKASQLDIPGLQQGLLTAPLPNRHFEYALTWFGLGWALLGVFGSVIYQRLKRAAP
ncbi:MAG: SURF1 family protein [Asticcacaulis sp.]